MPMHISPKNDLHFVFDDNKDRVYKPTYLETSGGYVVVILDWAETLTDNRKNFIKSSSRHIEGYSRKTVKDLHSELEKVALYLFK